MENKFINNQTNSINTQINNSKCDCIIDLDKVNNNLFPRYIDVHANSKYYFPVDTSGLDNSGLLREPNQWNDRSNRNSMYNSSGVRRASPNNNNNAYGQHDLNNFGNINMNMGMGLNQNRDIYLQQQRFNY